MYELKEVMEFVFLVGLGFFVEGFVELMVVILSESLLRSQKN